MAGHRKGPNQKLTQVPTVDWLRMAAYIECEGTIHAYFTDPATTKRKSPASSLVLKVHNSDPRLPYWCRDIFGGRVRAWSNNRKGRLSKYMDVFEWQACSKDAEEILRGCLPYFIIKREQAEVALLLRETVGVRLGRFGVPSEVLKKRETLHSELRRLKHELPEAAKAVIQ